MRTFSMIVVGGCALAFGATMCDAAVFTMNGTSFDVQAVAGTGSNKALLEMDFGTDASPQPFLFGFQWDGAAGSDGRQILVGLEDGATGVAFTDTFFAGLNSYFLHTHG
jgi:hypothetical protein